MTPFKELSKPVVEKIRLLAPPYLSIRLQQLDNKVADFLKLVSFSEISGFHGGEYEDGSLLGYSEV
jgi:hypothetical protein